jgi:hypothetical protein
VSALLQMGTNGSHLDQVRLMLVADMSSAV